MPDRAARLRVWGLTATLLVLALGLGWALSQRPRLDAPFTIPWPLLALLVVVAERYALHLRIRDQALTFTLSEIPIAIGLYFVAPLGLVAARVVGGSLTLLLEGRQAPTKFAFNVAQHAAEVTLAITAFQLASDRTDPVSLRSIGAAVGSVGLGGLFSIVAVWAVIAALRREDAGSVADTLVSGLPISLANAAVGMSVVVVAWLRPNLLWLPLVPLAILLVAYRAYVMQHQHRLALSALYETANEVHAETDLAAATERIVAATRRLLRCDVAELLFQFDASSDTAYLAAAGPSDAAIYRVGPVSSMPADLLRLLRSDHDGARDEGVVWRRTSFGTTGALLLRARAPLGRAGRLDRADADVLWSLSRLTVTALERAELDEVKQAFLTAVSHELRTPLTVVFGGIETLQQRHEVLDSASQRRLLDRIGVQARRLGDLLSDLLDLDRLQRGVVEPRRAPVELLTLARDTRDAIDATNHEVVVSGDEVVADIDAALVRRVVENLVVNAIKYAPTGTTVWLEVGADDEHATVIVADEGPGIPASQRQRVLQPFTRLHLDHANPGTGVGLALVERFTALHGGDVIIDDRPGGGARVTVRFPLTGPGDRRDAPQDRVDASNAPTDAPHERDDAPHEQNDAAHNRDDAPREHDETHDVR